MNWKMVIAFVPLVVLLIAEHALVLIGHGIDAVSHKLTGWVEA